MSANTGHGHVFPRPDGMKARCGGPTICRECALDQARKAVGAAAIHSDAFIQVFLGFLAARIPELGAYPASKLLGLWDEFKIEMGKL